MLTLALGLALFLGVHLLPVIPSLREAVALQLGDKPYRGLFSLVSLAGLALIVVGYRVAGPGAQLFAPISAAIAVAPVAMVIAFILFAAANMRTHLRHAIVHPMLYGTLIWSGVHLAANGEARATLLFGAFFVWALVDLLSVVQRRAIRVFEPSARQDVIAIIAGVAVALGVMTFHRLLFGVAVVPFSA